MGFRSDQEALHARIEHLESALASASGTEAAQRLAEAKKVIKKLTSERDSAKRELSHARDEIDRINAVGVRKRLIPPGAFQRSGVFGVALGVTIAVIYGVILVCGSIARGCTAEPLHAGYIVERVHHEAYATHGEICTGTGSSRSCTPTTTHHPERWTVIVADGAQEVEDAIDHDAWLATRNGEWFCVLPPCRAEPAPGEYQEMSR